MKSDKQRVKWQTSESFIVVFILTLVGGYLDAYTYIARGNVFANAQTGNICFLAMNIAKGKLISALFYLMSIIAFMLGIFLSELLHFIFMKSNSKFHWRQLIIIIEIGLLIITGLIHKGNFDIIVNIIISFVCALQVKTFRTYEGKVFASTMCTGNLMSATKSLFDGLFLKDVSYLIKSYGYYRVILSFMIGVILGTLFTVKYGTLAVFFCPILLFFSFILMFNEHI